MDCSLPIWKGESFIVDINHTAQQCVISYIIQSIEVEDVYFLEKDQKELELALEYKQYPPNIVLDAHGGEATGDAVLNVTLIGADKELKLDVFLEKSGSC